MDHYNYIVLQIFSLNFLNGFGWGQDFCGIKNVICNSTDIYRSIDGSCNNRENPNWGTVNSTYVRMLPPSYGDGQHSFPLTSTGQSLPNARNMTVYSNQPDSTDRCEKYTLSAMTYGQIIAHDLSFTLLPGSQQFCCTPQYTHHETEPEGCANIDVPEDDPVYSYINATCLPMLRTLTNRDLRCQEDLEYAEQISAVTNYLDLSVIYGQTNDEGRSLRAFEHGYLLTETRNGHQWPLSAPRPACSGLLNYETTCYRTGDVRMIQNLQLILIHIVWIREHNRIADELSKLNPHWDDEKLFQVARKINIGKYQHIAFYELLPIYCGYGNLVRNEVIFEKAPWQYVNDYKETVMPHVFNEFAHAAYRKFHSIVDGKLGLYNTRGCPYNHLVMRDHIDRPVVLEKQNIYDSLVRGLGFQPIMPSDGHYDNELTHGMFLQKTRFGEDLKAMDTNRGRDHGLAKYNDVRSLCGLPKAKTFAGFLDVIPQRRVDRLQTIYNDPNDVELLIGGEMENNVPGTLAGPTFLCILINQFRKTRQSDRFWFENDNGPAGFTPDQLKEIRKSSISKLLCDNSDISLFQINGFIKVSANNPIIPCPFINGPNLRLWREK